MFDMLKTAFGGGGVEKISPDQAKAFIKEGALVIDVREPGEIRSSGKIKGAINIPVGELAAKANLSSPQHDTRLNKDQTVILYCASGMRSGSAGNALKSLGYSKVYNLGPLSAWANAGGAVERG